MAKVSNLLFGTPPDPFRSISNAFMLPVIDFSDGTVL